MKKFGILIVLFLVAAISNAQNFKTINDLDYFCISKSTSTYQNANEIVDEILDNIGLFRNFVLQECPNINNAIAKNLYNDKGYSFRYILYDNNFFNSINKSANSDWASISILAHEIGHHLNGHALNNEGSTHQFELEADEFSGFVLAKMGASLAEAQSAINSLKYEKATASHPAKKDRLEIIEIGWNKAFSNNKRIIENELSEYSEENYLKGLEEFQKGNFEESFVFFLKAAEDGHPGAQWYVGEAYQGGVVILQDYKESRKWFEKSAEQGNANAQFALGWIYSNNIGDVKNDHKKAFENYLKASEQGNYKAQTFLGLMYYDGLMYGDGFVLKKDFKEAFKWLTLATNQGASPNGFAEYHLGLLYENGKGVAKDLNEALYWYEKAESLYNYWAPKKVKKIKKKLSKQ